MGRTGSTPDFNDPRAYGPVGRSAWLDVDWNEHQSWVEVDGRRLNVIEMGEGDPPVVFVHGLSGSWQNWLEQIPHIARSHRVVTMDLPGFGHSEMPSERISIGGYGRCVDALLERLGVAAAAVVGSSMGGFIGAELAIQFPERVERLVLVSAAGLTVEHQRNERALSLLRTVDRRLLTYAAWIGSKSDALARRPRARQALLGLLIHRPELLPGPLVAEQVRGSGKPGFVDALDALTDYPIRDRLGEIACPTLIVWGTEDKLVPVRDAADFERLIPDARKAVWADTGHAPMLERPIAFNALLEAFLAEPPGEEVDAGDAAHAADAPRPAAEDRSTAPSSSSGVAAAGPSPRGERDPAARLSAG